MVLKLLLAGVAVLVSLVAGEAWLRGAQPRYFNSLQWEYEPDLGWTNRPEAIYYNVMGDRKPIRIEFNRRGFRDLDHAEEKPAYTRRIIVIGDSFSEATQVNLDDTYWRRLGTALNAESGVRWETLNFGVGDYGTTQEYLTLITRGLRYDPDLVVLQVAPINDICNNGITAADLCSPQDVYRPYLDPARGYESLTYLSPVRTWLRKHLLLFRFGEFPLLRGARRLMGRPGDSAESEWRDHLSRTLTTLGWPTEHGFAAISLNTFAPDDHQAPFIRQGWTATEHAIARIHDAVAARNIPMVVLVAPSTWELQPNYRELSKVLPFPIDRYSAEMRLWGFLGRRGVPVVRLIDRLERHPGDTPPYVLGHFDVAAHGIVAGALLEEVRKALPEVPPYALGQPLSFGRNMNGVKFLVYGFSNPEGNSAWTAHPKAGLRLALPPVSRPLLLTLRAAAFAPPQLGAQQFVDVVFNGRAVTRWTLTGRAGIAAYEARIAPSLVPSSGASELEFRFSDRKSPQELGMNDDYRRLGLGLVEMSLRED